MRILENTTVVEALKNLYVENDHPSDRIRSREYFLEAFAAAFNKRNDSDFTPNEVGDAMIYLRKSGQLPRLGRGWSGPTLYNPAPN